MKKFFLIFFIPILLFGCGKSDEKTVTNKLKSKIENTEGYIINGTLTIYRDEDIYTYDVKSTYSNNDYYKVNLINKTNNHEQIILRNKDGVYVLTPSLKKSFKFQSDWPYNNSQIYILQQLVQDIVRDDKKIFEETKDGYIYTATTTYINDPQLIKQKIYFDKSLNLTKVEVMNSNDEIKMQLDVQEMKIDESIDDNQFIVDESYNQNNDKRNDTDKQCEEDSCEETEQETANLSVLKQIVYPMYIPQDTYLTSQDKIKTDTTERVILTFQGEKPFILVQEVNTSDYSNTEYVSGDPYMVTDTIGALNSNSVSWNSGNVEYYLVSNDLSQEELLTVAKSVNVLAVSK